MFYVAITFDNAGLIVAAESTSKGPVLAAHGQGYNRRLSKTVFGGAGPTKDRGQTYLGPFTKESEAEGVAATLHSAILAIDNARVILAAGPAGPIG